jgi:predicted transporter
VKPNVALIIELRACLNCATFCGLRKRRIFHVGAPLCMLIYLVTKIANQGGKHQNCQFKEGKNF